MTTPYFESADEATAGLGLPLLIAASADTAVPRAAARLSELAVETMLGGRLYSRLRLPDAKGGQVLWVCGPFGSQEHLSWAAAVAEHAVGCGRTGFLLDASAERPLQSLAGGKGLDLPEGLQDRIESLGLGPAAGWASDLAGVRIVLPTGEPPAGVIPPDPARWSLIISRALPDPGSRPSSGLCSGIDGIIFVAAIRDHSREELTAAVAALRALEVPLLGFVALGPVPKPKLTPLERWDRIDPWALSDRKEEGLPSTAPGSSPSADAPAARPPVPIEPVARGIEPEMAPISLGMWEPPKPPRRTGLWLIPAILLAAAIAGTGYVRGWWRQPSGGPPVATQTPVVTTPADSTKLSAVPTAPDTLSSGGALWDSIASTLEGGSPGAEDVTSLTDGGWPDTFVVHVNSFNHVSFAEREASRLSELGLSVRVVSIELPKRGRWYRVVIGAFPDSSAASIEASLLRERQLVSFAQILNRGGRGSPRKSAPQ